jgi:DNA polymerase-3 subunit epsilon
MGLPQEKIEVSAMFYEWKRRQQLPYQHDIDIDLRFASIMKELELPPRDAHRAINDAVMAALAFIKLRHLRACR